MGRSTRNKINMVELLPGDCLCHVLSFTSPLDACTSSRVSATFQQAADSDAAWEKFLPCDYKDIISRSVSPVPFSSYKQLFHKLSSLPLLIDGGTKTFCMDKNTSKRCYMFSARELSITWSSDSLCWCWKKPLGNSRFPEAVELIMVWWLEIRGRINTKILSPNTTYGAYLLIQITNRAFGLKVLPSEVWVEVGDYKTRGMIYLKRDECKTQELGEDECKTQELWEEERVLRARGDGWLEVELGEFYNDGCSDKEVIMGLRERGVQLKGGLIVEGIELRPKH